MRPMRPHVPCLSLRSFTAALLPLQALDRWEQRLEAIFEGKPYDILDAALSDTITRFPLDIQPFRDMIEGMRMDLVKSRYETFDELYEYCYRVAGTVALMSMPVMGIDPKFKVHGGTGCMGGPEPGPGTGTEGGNGGEGGGGFKEGFYGHIRVHRGTSVEGGGEECVR